MCLREIVFLPELNIGVVKAVFGAEGLCIALGTEKDNLFVERCYAFYLSGSADAGENIERYSEEEFEVYRVIATVKLNRLNIGINPDYLAFSALYVYRSVNKALSCLCQIYSYVFYALFISALNRKSYRSLCRNFHRFPPFPQGLQPPESTLSAIMTPPKIT